MPALGTITINDGQSTPVAHSFSPVKIDVDTATYADRLGGVPAGYPVLTAANRDPANGQKVNRMFFGVAVPILADGTDVNIPEGTLLRTFRANVEVLVPTSSTLAERKDGLAYLRNFLADAVVTALVRDLEHVY